MPITPDELQDFARRYTTAWCSRDPARVATFFAPNGALQVNDAVPAMGHQAIEEIARSFMAAFPDMQVLMDGVEIHGDRSHYHWTLVGTNSGPGGTGKRVRISGYEVWEFAPDGRISRSLGHFDSTEYARQLREGI
jgi:predicted ester cyclase